MACVNCDLRQAGLPCKLPGWQNSRSRIGENGCCHYELLAALCHTVGRGAAGAGGHTAVRRDHKSLGLANRRRLPVGSLGADRVCFVAKAEVAASSAISQAAHTVSSWITNRQREPGFHAADLTGSGFALTLRHRGAQAYGQTIW